MFGCGYILKYMYTHILYMVTLFHPTMNGRVRPVLGIRVKMQNLKNWAVALVYSRVGYLLCTS